MFLRASAALIFRFFRITALRFLGIEDPHVIQAEARQSAAEAGARIACFGEHTTAVDSDPALCIPYCHGIIILEMVGRCMPKDDYPALQNGESLKPHPNCEITRTFMFPAVAFV